MEAIVDITQKEIESALASEEVAAKIKLRRLSQANLIEHVKNIPYKAVNGPKVKSSKFNMSPELKNLNVSPKTYLQSIIGKSRPINVKEDKTENIRKHNDVLAALTLEQESEIEAPSIVEEKVEVPEVVQEFQVSQDLPVEKVMDEQVNEPETAEAKNESENDVTEENSNVEDNSHANDSDDAINISEYATRLDNETQLLKQVEQKVAETQQGLADKEEIVSKLSMEISEAEKREKMEDERKIENERRLIELDKQIATAYEEQCRIQRFQRKQQEDLLKELTRKSQEEDNKIVQFNSQKNDIEKRTFEKSEINARENEQIMKKEALLAAILPQNNFSDTMMQENIVQFHDMDETEEKVKRIA